VIAPALCAPVEEVLRGTPAERVLDRVLRAHRAWSAAERATASELVFGIALWRLRLAEAADRVPGDVMIALYLRDLAGWPEERVRAATGVATLPPPREPVELSVRYSMPAWLVDRLAREVHPVEPLLAALDVPGPITLRANPLKASRDALIDELREQDIDATAAAYSPTAVQVARRFNVYGSPAFREGRFELQDEGSQLLGHLVQARPGEAVLDFCAGAGGKTLLLAAALENRGTLWAHDVDPERLDRLSVRAARAGAQVRVLRAMPEDLRVDAVLVDAPCSELGALRRGPDLRFRLRPEELDALPELQRRILAQAARHVRPGGRLVYATCTWNRAENEEVVEALLAREPEFELAGLPDWAAPFRAGKYFKSFPHLHGTDGFFAAILTRRP
jgi:16S rRNA (cytosine967-C5)-methyltransferase